MKRDKNTPNSTHAHSLKANNNTWTNMYTVSNTMKNENFRKNLISPSLILSKSMADKFAGSC